jgi:hypothetical protein
MIHEAVVIAGLAAALTVALPVASSAGATDRRHSKAAAAIVQVSVDGELRTFRFRVR